MRCVKFILPAIVTATLATGNAAVAGGREAATLCHPDESVFFSCPLGKKTVSLCSSGKPDKITALTYRYGMKDHVENEYVAIPDNGNRFLADREPAARGVEVTSVWFNQGNVRYLVTQCTGDCSHDAGLTVLRDNKIVTNRYCDGEEKPGGDMAFFSLKILDYNDTLDDAKAKRGDNGVLSHTDLLLVVNGENNQVERIYPVPEH
ncbi:hypothetical protein [Telmatospirillum sp.]|uniref:hypothetical protein n=1 Tax=Telmatospirillum sp. TaxID=2079197 RepID=UPI002849A778|nr:hypothetical protein [Telmatospirillum sp.]MDR3435270.1 hypothetical protein [Telmatospirillum sp.]